MENSIDREKTNASETYSGTQESNILLNHVHNFRKTGNVKHVVNFFGDARYDKVILTERPELHETYPQKGRGNVNHFIEIEYDSDIFVEVSEFGNPTQQFLF